MEDDPTKNDVLARAKNKVKRLKNPKCKEL